MYERFTSPAFSQLIRIFVCTRVNPGSRWPAFVGAGFNPARVMEGHTPSNGRHKGAPLQNMRAKKYRLNAGAEIIKFWYSLREGCFASHTNRAYSRIFYAHAERLSSGCVCKKKSPKAELEVGALKLEDRKRQSKGLGSPKTPRSAVNIPGDNLTTLRFGNQEIEFTPLLGAHRTRRDTPFAA